MISALRHNPQAVKSFTFFCCCCCPMYPVRFTFYVLTYNNGGNDQEEQVQEEDEEQTMVVMPPSLIYSCPLIVVITSVVSTTVLDVDFYVYHKCCDSTTTVDAAAGRSGEKHRFYGPLHPFLHTIFYHTESSLQLGYSHEAVFAFFYTFFVFFLSSELPFLHNLPFFCFKYHFALPFYIHLSVNTHNKCKRMAKSNAGQKVRHKKNKQNHSRNPLNRKQKCPTIRLRDCARIPAITTFLLPILVQHCFDFERAND